MVGLALLLLAPFAFAYLSGSTFGQRCERAFRDDPAQQERCVDRLSKGGFVYPQPSTKGE